MVGFVGGSMCATLLIFSILGIVAFLSSVAAHLQIAQVVSHVIVRIRSYNKVRMSLSGAIY